MGKVHNQKANGMRRPTYLPTPFAFDLHLLQELDQHMNQGTYQTSTTQSKQQLLQKERSNKIEKRGERHVDAYISKTQIP